jgi:tRNA threonylcarbamoyladenosine biosynthesis protein TsaB
MRVLALDTSTRAGGIALVQDGRVVEERCGNPARAHAERLPREIVVLLDAHGISTADVDLFAVASGPGSFTGLRIGIATIQGLAFVHRRRIAAVSALEALAHVGSGDVAAGSLVAAWMDAQRRDVFSALYRVGPFPPFDLRRLIEVAPPQVADPTATLRLWQDAIADEPLVFIGDGAETFAATIGANHPNARIMPHPLLAGAIGRIGETHVVAGLALDPGAVRPVYVRRPDAEVERDRRQATR